MKKILVAFMVCVVMGMTSCVSMHTAAYVPAAEDFPGETISYNGWKNELTYGDYKIDFNRMVNHVASFSVMGFGMTGGSAYKTGVFMKGGRELFDVMVVKNVDGLSVLGEDFSFSSEKAEFFLRFSGNGGNQTYELYPYGDREVEIVASDPFEFEMARVSDAKDSSGRVNHMLWNANVGSKVVVNGELYAVVDDIYNPARVRVNPDFPEELSEEQVDNIAAMMMMVHYTKGYFQDQSESASITIGF